MTMISGRRLLFDQEIDFGERKLIELVANSLDMPEQIVRDVVTEGRARCGFEPRSTGRRPSPSAIVEILRPELKRLVAEIERGFLYAASESRGIRRAAGISRRQPGAVAGSRPTARCDRANPRDQLPDPLAALAPEARRVVPAHAIPEIAVATGLALRGVVAVGKPRSAGERGQRRELRPSCTRSI